MKLCKIIKIVTYIIKTKNLLKNKLLEKKTIFKSKLVFITLLNGKIKYFFPYFQSHEMKWGFAATMKKVIQFSNIWLLVSGTF